MELLDEAGTVNDTSSHQGSLHTLWSDEAGAVSVVDTESLWIAEHGTPVWISKAADSSTVALNEQLSELVYELTISDPEGVKKVSEASNPL